ncbi:MAG: DUF3310 domain-containing protein [Shewanella sp.]
MNESTLVPREEMSDLDWLARNVHEWHFFTDALAFVNNGAVKWQDPNLPRNTGFIDRDQWLASRAELQNKPSWKDAPEWAEFLSQSADGTWYWHELIPSKGNFLFFNGGGKRTTHCNGEVLGDWRDTLEKRPDASKMPSHGNQPKPSTDIPECAEVKQFEPFVSVEDAATAKQYDPVNSPSHYASGGIECIEAIKASMSHEAFLGYLKGNVQKYMWRYEKKVNPAEDLKKAKWYLSKLIEEQK